MNADTQSIGIRTSVSIYRGMKNDLKGNNFRVKEFLVNLRPSQIDDRANTEEAILTDGKRRSFQRNFPWKCDYFPKSLFV